MEIGYAFLEFRPWVLSEGRAALHLLVQAFPMPALSRRDRSDSLRERNGHHTAEQEVWVVAKLAMVNSGTVHCLTFAKDSTQYRWKVCAQGAAHSSETGSLRSDCWQITHIGASMAAK